MKRKDIETLFQTEEKAIKKQRAKNSASNNNLTHDSNNNTCNSNKMRKNSSKLSSVLKPTQLIEQIESDAEKKGTFTSSDNNLKNLKTNGSGSESLSTICRASMLFSDALKSLRYRSTKRWHQTTNLSHNHSFYHNHHPQSNINLPSFSVENIGSTILKPQQIAVLWKWLPLRYQILELEVIYSTNIHGCRLMTLFDKIEYYQATIIVIRTSINSIFGAFCSQPWSNRSQSSVTSKKPTFFGNGETFLFELAPKTKKYDWIGLGRGGDTTHNQEMFMYADNEKLMVGGGNTGIGLSINSDITYGKSNECDTFENEVLGTESEFTINTIEVLSFS
jgi:hypothetical protein